MLPVLLQDMRYLTWQQAFADSILIHIIHVHFSRGFYGIYIVLEYIEPVCLEAHLEAHV